VEDLNTIRIDLNSKDGREVVENLLRLHDMGGHNARLIGRAKNGSAVLIFRSTRPHDKTPCVRGADHHQRTFALASKDGTIRVNISTDSTAPLDGYKWERDIAHDELPMSTTTAAELGQHIIEEAFGLGLTWAEIVDRDIAVEQRVEQFKRDVASGKIKLKSEAEIAAEAEARRDEETVAANEGREVNEFDGPHAQMILAARGRHALRQRTQTVAA
jgi:hypothetical protein